MGAVKLPKDAAALGAVAVVGLVVVFLIAKKAVTATAGAAAGIVSGNNAVTENQTNAAGEKTTAYKGAGVLGTLGAAANSASGGVFASIGEAASAWFYDATHDDPLAPKPLPVDTSGTGTGRW